MQQAVFHSRVRHLYMISELEAALKGAAGDTTMEISDTLAILLNFSTHGQGVVFYNNINVVLAKPSDSKGDAVIIV